MAETDLAHLQLAEAMIAERGFAVQGVVETPLCYAYTVGLTARGHPELVILAVPLDLLMVANGVLCVLGERALTEPLAPDRTYPIGTRHVRVRQGLLGAAYPGIAHVLYGRSRVTTLLVEPAVTHG
jgi:hypothetical protein